MVVETDSPQRIARLTPLADALARLDTLVEPATPRVADLSRALGRILAEDVVIAAPIPPTARALRDGWALRSDLTTDASGRSLHMRISPAHSPVPMPMRSLW